MRDCATMLARRSIALVLLLASCVPPVFASSSGVVRDLTSTTFRACPAPRQLKEHYTVFSVPYGESVQVACLRDPHFAEWILSAESVCTDTECGPKLAFPEEGKDKTGDPPAVMTYNASKYDIDWDCELQTSTRSYGHDVLWSCKASKAISKPVRFQTLGATTATSDTKTPALRFDVVKDR